MASFVFFLISYLFYIKISVVIQRLVTPEDVCWNIRNVKIKFDVYHRSLLFVSS